MDTFLSTSRVRASGSATKWVGSTGHFWWMALNRMLSIVILVFCHLAYMKSNVWSLMCLYCSTLTWVRYIEYLIGTKQTPFPDQKFPTIQTLCTTILERFSAKNLRLCVQGKLSTAGKPRPLETQYQDEFYRAFNSVVPPGVPISSEWSRKGDGRIDFWIPQKRWGIELLRDHNRVNEHCDRFKKGGRYYSWIEDGLLEDWIIIDCATSPASGTLSHFVSQSLIPVISLISS